MLQGMFRTRLSRLLDLDWVSMTMAVAYGSDGFGFGIVRHAEDWPLASFLPRLSADETSAARYETTSE
ncbi:hypothetical protein UP06_14520 [Bradyrhizobium sp. LTSP857]|nr:hypothetical protein UP06_14520 [Bradyrhizobium sp. LTSP857]